jgi:prenylcysteine oxidase/farnesylcysteine lyase
MNQETPSNHRPKIAVIGAGAGGTQAAYTLVQHFGKQAEVQVFEAADQAGGRAHDVIFAGQRIEIGGTVVHSSNRLTNELMQFTGTSEDTDTALVGTSADYMWFHDSRKLLLKIKNSTFSFAKELILHYGPFSTWRFRSAALQTVNRWNRIYQVLEQQTFENPAEITAALQIQPAVENSLRDTFDRIGVSRKFTEDFAGAIIQNMYTQDETVNALTGEVGLAGAGLVGGHLFSIAGGNGKLFAHTLEKLQQTGNLQLHLNSRVTDVSAVPSSAITAATPGSVRLKLEDGTTADFDSVIIAVPLELSGIRVWNGDQEITPAPRPYKKVVATLIAGELNLRFFGIPAAEIPQTPVPTAIFVKANQGAAYKSVGITGRTSAGQSIYKVFSDESLPAELIQNMFQGVSEQYEHRWPGAYPVLRPVQEFTPFRLGDSIYYSNAFESVSSTIEVNQIPARNVAQLVIRDLGPATS